MLAYTVTHWTFKNYSIVNFLAPAFYLKIMAKVTNDSFYVICNKVHFTYSRN